MGLGLTGLPVGLRDPAIQNTLLGRPQATRRQALLGDLNALQNQPSANNRTKTPQERPKQTKLQTAIDALAILGATAMDVASGGRTSNVTSVADAQKARREGNQQQAALAQASEGMTEEQRAMLASLGPEARQAFVARLLDSQLNPQIGEDRFGNKIFLGGTRQGEFLRPEAARTTIAEAQADRNLQNQLRGLQIEGAQDALTFGREDRGIEAEQRQFDNRITMETLMLKNREVASKLAKGDRDAADEQFSQVQALRKEFTAVTGSFEDFHRQYQIIRDNLALGTGPGDAAAIIAFNKILDENSVVRESEFARTANLGGLLDKLGVFAKNLEDGQLLNSDIRRDLLQSADTILGSIGQLEAQKRTLFEGEANVLGVDPARIMGPEPEYGFDANGKLIRTR